ncbi:MAG TPA: bifunctional homocysteine S-methyltransferase/methylenetetrahydrofolate reductase [Myxococcales bacterium]|nr:bifunctional homocysteine S-methyltransferase/methylenetetrahydrofolate reductase [Myxococcales bacterium]HAN32837.1 bifunctional homocysteine S-methyltransferase/methylenetetrahydrofolate reductase [Myxococcales bacterium]
MWSKSQLQALLDQRIVVFDGAMGTQLYEQGFSFQQSLDALCVENPLVVRRVHRDYVGAGARILTANSFGANRMRLDHKGSSAKIIEINQAAVAIARDAAMDRPPHNRPLVAASVGPLGQPMAPVGRISEAKAREVFTEQIEALLDADPDLFIFETFSDLNELLVAIDALNSLYEEAAFVALATFNAEGKTLLGHKPEEVVRAVLAAGAAAAGGNCGVGPQGMEEVFERMCRVAEARLVFTPNAGLPQVIDGRLHYVNSPEYFAQWAEELVQRGARGIGGCCGTTPEHIARAVQAIGSRSPVPLQAAYGESVSSVVESGGTSSEVQSIETDSSSWSDSDFENKLSTGQFVVSVELDPPRGVNAERLVRGAVACRQAGVDAINIADSPMATARMSPLALAVLIRQQVDIEILLHVSCRDRNVLGLLSETMGAHALGVRHMLCVTGDPPSVGDYPGTRAVFEVDSIGLLTMLNGLNHGRNANGKPRKYNTDFRLSCAVNPTAEDLDREIEKFHAKQDAGAKYALTQPIYDIDIFEQFLERAKPKIPLLVGILPLRNARHAHFIHHEVPGMYVPETIRKRMDEAGESGPSEGVVIGREFLERVRPLCAGAYLMPPFNKFEMAIELLKD